MAEMLSVTQWAKLQGRDPSRVRRLIQEGRIPAQKVGSQWVISSDVTMPPDKRVKTGAYKNWRKKQEE